MTTTRVEAHAHPDSIAWAKKHPVLVPDSVRRDLWDVLCCLTRAARATADDMTSEDPAHKIHALAGFLQQHAANAALTVEAVYHRLVAEEADDTLGVGRYLFRDGDEEQAICYRCAREVVSSPCFEDRGDDWEGVVAGDEGNRGTFEHDGEWYYGTYLPLLPQAERRPCDSCMAGFGFSK